MKKAIITVVVLLFVIVCACAVLRPELRSRVKRAAKPQGPVSAVGYVVDADGRPVAGAEVMVVTHTKVDPSPNSFYWSMIEGEVKVTARVVSGRDGSFVFRGLPKARLGMYYLIARKSGKYMGWTYCPSEYFDDKSFCPNPYADYRIVVNKLEKRTGQVVDLANKPIAGAEVDLVELGPGRAMELSPFGTTPGCSLGKHIMRLLGIRTVSRTDKDGKYSFSALPEDSSALIKVIKSGVPPVNPGPFSLVPVMRIGSSAPERGTIRGRVVDIGGKPVSGIKIFAINGYAAVTCTGTGVTDKDGCYIIKNLPSTRYSLHIVGSKEYSLDQNNTAKALPEGVTVDPGADLKAPDVVAVRCVPVTGRVVDKETGKPVVGVRVIANRYAPEAQTDKHGGFKLWLAPGSAVIMYAGGNSFYKPSALSPHLYPGGCVPDGAVTVNIPAKGLDGVTIKPERTQTIKGRVVDQKGKPVSGALLSLGECPANWTSSGRDGRFEISLFNAYGRSLSPPYGNSDSVVFRVRDAANNRSFTTYVSGQDANKDIKVVVMPQAKVRVVVRDLKGKPVKDAVVSVNGSRPRVTDGKGYVFFSDLMNAPAYLPRLAKAGYLQASGNDLAAITGKKAQSTANSAKVDKDGVHVVEATMVPVRRVQKGKVVDADGKPVWNACVEMSFGVLPGNHIRAMSDFKGEFVLQNVPDVPVRITASNFFTYAGSAMSGPEYVVIKVSDKGFGGHAVLLGSPKSQQKAAN